MPDPMLHRRILMGVVGRPHGVRGLVRVHSYTADPADLAGYGPLQDDAGRAWTLAWRGSGIAELRGADGQPVAGRDAAERLVNTQLWLDRDRLPPAEDGEFYLADLVGMAALDPAGQAIGRVTVVHDYGPGTAPLLGPFTHARVPHVDPAAGTLVVAEPDEILVEDTAEAAE